MTMEETIAWSPPPPVLVLPCDEVHVWRIALDRPSHELAHLKEWLSPDEQARADRLRFEVHRGRFIAGRGALRMILGRLMQIAPHRVVFRYEKSGKPALSEDAEAIEFNLSHSEGLGLLAIARGRRVGIDMEHLRPLTNVEPIIGRFFSASECAEFGRVPEPLKVRAFYHGWTRKEAYIKAIGAGIAFGLDQFDVSLTPGEAPRLRNVRGDSEEAGRWSYADLDPAPGFLGAVIAEGKDWRLRCFHASPLAEPRAPEP